jgi:RimJ/RimL family protein N-acetyltransferase
MTTPAAPRATESPVALTAEEIWPVTGLRVVSGDLELRYLDDDLLFRLAALASQGIHSEDAMPFTTPWTRGTPLEVARSVLTYHWGGRGAVVGSGKMRLELAVLHAGVPVGIQGFFGDDVAVTRTVETGSWLGLAYQRQGIGTRMRRLVLHLLFEGLGRDVAETVAFADNAPSNGVTRRIGYEANGVDVVAREGKPAVSNRYRLTREAWEVQPGRPEVELRGAAPVRQLLGLDRPTSGL